MERERGGATCIDAERIFAYRALRFARNDATPLPGFEENDYVPAARCERRTLADLMAEYTAVHHASLELFVSMDEKMLLSTGVANGNRTSVRAIGWTIAGHVLHHVSVLNARYLDHGPA
ncbi:MAG: DNA damage-inducible protein DinB [Flavobacteriales bacterium]|nr:DNA damage-inducible protein DinB [Flavobacteriales bacterium]